ncbi:MAG: RIP metalloprotease RseP [Gemmatimonadota bacterium]
MNFLISIAALLVVLGVLVFVHEAGHFIAAKAAGIYVHRFSLGLGPPIKALSFTRGETEYVISWLPLGGYVKMASREEEATSSMLEGGKATVVVPPDRFFESKPVWKRMIVILAGVMMNGLFAWVVYTGMALVKGERVDPETRFGIVETKDLPAEAKEFTRLTPGDRITSINGVPVNSWDDIVERLQTAHEDTLVVNVDGKEPVRVVLDADALEGRLGLGGAIGPYLPAVLGEVQPNEPGARAGLVSGDTIVAINGKPIVQWYELLSMVQPMAGKPVAIEIGRPSGRRTINVTPRAEPSVDGKSTRGYLGIGVHHEYQFRKLGVADAVRSGTKSTVAASTLIVRSLRGMFKGMISPRTLGGPIAIGQLAGQSIRLGLDVFLAFMALISVNLAVLNLLPVPVLDGGQFVFLLAEGVTRRPLSLKLRERLTAVGLVLIVLLMVFAFSNDILKALGI